MTDTNLVRFRAAVAGALAQLESRRQEVNDLNVFPVADGDTGDNMVLTLRAVLAELDRLQGSDTARTIDEIGREEIVQSVARAALLGARGNSGVILSQLIRGAAEELVSRPGELIDPMLVGAALAQAADRAYSSVRDPAEGTILTVAREMAHQIMSDVAHSYDSPRLESATEPRTQDLTIAQTLERALTAGQEAVKRGPELLAELRDAGVVDAGGYGLTVIFAGVVAALRGEEPPPLEHHAPARVSHPEHSSSTYRFCTNFAVIGSGLEAARFIEPLERIGDSVLVVGDSTTLKVHVHTDTPEHATAMFAEAGTISHIDVADMSQQVAERDARLQAGARDGAAGSAVKNRCAALAVVSGDGVAELFHELGVQTFDGGPTMNPSTYELHAAIHEVAAEEVLVLANSPNVIMVAEHAAEMSDKRVLVVPSASQQAGLAIAVALDPDRRRAARTRARLRAALARVRTGAVRPGRPRRRAGRFRRGEAVGFVDEEIVCLGRSGSDPARRCWRSWSPDAELISVLEGERAPLDLATVTALANGNGRVELELRHGGQPAYWWLLSAE